jgi:hypothetical protein
VSDLTKTKREAELARSATLAKATEKPQWTERVCAACGEVESVHILPQQLAALREAERRGLGQVVAVQGIALRGSNCWECKQANGSGECLGHPWHHFVWHKNEGVGLPELTERSDEP